MKTFDGQYVRNHVNGDRSLPLANGTSLRKLPQRQPAHPIVFSRFAVVTTAARKRGTAAIPPMCQRHKDAAMTHTPSTIDPPASSTDVPTLPSLDPGLTLLESDGRATGPLQSLVLDHLMLTDGEARWVDANGNASTTALAAIAPSRRTLSRIQVARAFTAFQHYSLIETLAREITSDTSLVVVPDVAWFYEGDDLAASEGETMLAHALDQLRDVAAAHDLPVLLSWREGSPLSDCVAGVCDRTLEYVRTAFGPRFCGDEFETLVFDCTGGGVQTTLAFWRRVLARRHAVAESALPAEVPTRGSH